jgi:hypothetical protein
MALLFNSQQGKEIFSFLKTVQTSSGTHPISYLMGTMASFPELKKPGCEGEHPPPSSAKINPLALELTF